MGGQIARPLLYQMNDYHAYHEEAVFYEQKPSGYLRLSGPDPIDFVQRQSTNDIRRLSPEEAVLTVLTSPTARILDVFYVLQEPVASGSGIALLSMTGRAAEMYRYLKNHIFFMDKVSIDDLSAEYAQLSIGGQKADQALRQLGVDRQIEANRIIDLVIRGASCRLLRQDDHIGLEYRLILPSAGCDAVEAALQEAGIQPISADAYEILRVEKGLPAGGSELTGEYTPLETNLESAVSGTKGCYTGQEVIARQVTYDKVVRGLAGLRLEKGVQPGDRVFAQGKPAGVVTSAVRSPRLGVIALAVLRRPYHEAGASITVISGGEEIPGQVVELPFIS